MLSAKLKKEVLRLAKETPLTLKELAELTGTTEKRMFRIIRSLFEKGEIDPVRDDSGKSRYRASQS
jgi:DNA-binding MarR family transcriptional regulator